MRRALFIVGMLVIAGCGKAVPVENPSMTYLEASKIVEDLEKELAAWEAMRRQAIESRDWQLSHLKSRDASEEERNAERTEILSRHTEISSNLAKLIDEKQAQIKRAKADRDAIRDRD